MTMEIRKGWNVFVDVDENSHIFATLHQDGKIDYTIEVRRDQLDWFNALRSLLLEDGHLMYRP